MVKRNSEQVENCRPCRGTGFDLDTGKVCQECKGRGRRVSVQTLDTFVS